MPRSKAFSLLITCLYPATVVALTNVGALAVAYILNVPAMLAAFVVACADVVLARHLAKYLNSAAQ